MLSDDKHCEMLAAQIRDRNTHILDSFKLFVQIFSAIVGGAIFLKLQARTTAIPPTFAWEADGLSALVVLVCAIMILEHSRGWYQYRKRLSEVAGFDANGKPVIPPPKPRALLVEATMLCVMGGSYWAFCVFNPL